MGGFGEALDTLQCRQVWDKRRRSLSRSRVRSGGTPQIGQDRATPARGGTSTRSTADVDGTGSQTGQSQDVEGGACPAEPLEAFRQALEAHDADEAWTAWTSMSDGDRGGLDESEVASAVGLATVAPSRDKS